VGSIPASRTRKYEGPDREIWPFFFARSTLAVDDAHGDAQQFLKRGAFMIDS
jgi:hypothetical protein